MSKPWIHAVSSAKKFGGTPEDYVEIHSFMDTSKGALPDNRHRALTHTSWFLSVVLERVFGVVIRVTLYDASGQPKGEKMVSVRDIGEQHILEDFGGKYIPTAQDFLQEMEFKAWMNGSRKHHPPSYEKVAAGTIVTRIDLDRD